MPTKCTNSLDKKLKQCQPAIEQIKWAFIVNAHDVQWLFLHRTIIFLSDFVLQSKDTYNLI